MSPSLMCGITQTARRWDHKKMAGGQGFEPWLTGPEPVVLPLNDPPVQTWKSNSFPKNVKLNVDMRCPPKEKGGFRFSRDIKSATDVDETAALVVQDGIVK